MAKLGLNGAQPLSVHAAHNPIDTSSDPSFFLKLLNCQEWRLWKAVKTKGWSALISEAGLRTYCGGGSSFYVLMFLLNMGLLTTSLFFAQSCKMRSEWGSSLAEMLASSYNLMNADPQSARSDGDTVDWAGTSELLKQVVDNGTQECHNIPTKRAAIFGLPQPAPGGDVELETDRVHEFTIVSYSENGSRRCYGGDYYETDLSGPQWRSRPPITDLGDGAYHVKLHVHRNFAGNYTFKAVLLFSNLHGLNIKPETWIMDQELIKLQISFIASRHFIRTLPPKPPRCRKEHFNPRLWQGQWTRTKFTEPCEVDSKGRYLCLKETDQCDEPWCDGAIAKLESNGWAYSAHCSFHIWANTEAWECLRGRWLYFWGDSNHQDTIRNLLNFILGVNTGLLNRTFDQIFTNPADQTQTLRITAVFNGHYDERMNNLGLSSLDSPFYRREVQKNLNREAVPDAILLNSGLHDGKRWPSLEEFVDAAEFSALFWDRLYRNATAGGGHRPVVIYRTTVAPAGESRSMPSNPHKMEVFNRVMVEKMAERLPIRVVDGFDMTFPWHFDNNCSDGGHYGRPPKYAPWFGQVGHWYFVDLMLVHVLLNVMCPFA